ncbi:MAG TPA: iron-containing redox enzyme family protein [Candidatus Kryptonia bacterium]|nr:iron-containing redox enzyme family protein [Candidatus Kryptonia bacterium]
MSTSAFKNVITSRAVAEPEPIDDYLASLDRMIAEIMCTRDRITAAIGGGTASLAVVKRIAKEYYYLGRWMTPDFAVFVANAPDAFSLTMDYSEHYAHWCQNFADEAGYLRDPNHVSMKWEWCQQLGIGAEELEAYVPLPETIAVTFTMLYYVRRSYEEGLAVFGFAGERLAARSGYAKTMYEGLQQHYGMTVKNFEVHAYAEPDHGDKAEALFRKVVTTASVQRRCREAIRNVMMVREARTKALNALLD